MNNEELKKQQQILNAEYQSKIEAEPEVKKWIESKKRIRLFGILYLLIYFGIECGAYISINAEFNAMRLAFKALFSIAWFAFFMFPTGDRKISYMFYVSAIYNAMGIVKAYTSQNGFSLYFQNGLLWSIYLIMSILLPILFFVLACWLTLPKKNIELSDRALALNREHIENLKQMQMNK